MTEQLLSPQTRIIEWISKKLLKRRYRRYIKGLTYEYYLMTGCDVLSYEDWKVAWWRDMR